MSTKKELLDSLQSKVGFVRIISDEKTNDSKEGDSVEKRHLVIQHNNTDGTAGITNVFYLHDKESDEAKFYNEEPEAFDKQEPTVNQKKMDKILKHLTNNFDLVEILFQDDVQEKIKAKVNKFSGSKSVESLVIAYKDKETKDFTHVTIE